MNRLVLIVTLICLSILHSFCSEIKEFLTKETNFTTEQINTVTKLVDNAIREELPEEFIYQRVREGVTKKVEYILLYTTLIEKIAKLKIAKLLLEEFFNVPEKDINYCVQYLSEQLDQGLTAEEFVYIAKYSIKHNLKILPKDFLKYTALIIYAKHTDIELSEAKETILNGMAKGTQPKQLKTILKSIELEKFREELKKEIDKKHIER